MGWLARTPSQDRIDLWRGISQGGHKIAKWPHPNTVRIDPMFRLDFTSPTMIPLASRYGFIYWPDGDDYGDGTPETEAFGWFDAETIAKNHIRVTTPENEFGYSAQIDWNTFPEEEPFEPSGVEVTIALTRDTGGTQVQRGRFFWAPPATTWEWNHDTIRKPPATGSPEAQTNRRSKIRAVKWRWPWPGDG